MVVNDSNLVPKSSDKFYCHFCHYNTSRKSQYDRHLSTDKHKNKENGSKMVVNDSDLVQKVPHFVCDCGKIYKYDSGYYRHKKKCKFDYVIQNTNAQVEDKDDVKLLTNIVLEVVKQNQELMNQNSEFQKQVFELCKNGTNNTMINNNSHNKTFNLNVFLNEHCKDAMNIMEFVDSLKLQLSDLENVGKLGFVEGISNIIVKNLQALDVHKRPVHCSDSKREVMYIKDEDKWEKENDEKLKLRKAIKRIANKNTRLLPEFKQKHPDCGKSESAFSDQYNKLIIEAMGGSGNEDFDNENKIIKKIAKEVTISKLT
jgi:hypothetical protein